MSTSLYEDLLNRAEQLKPQDRMRLIQELIAQVQRQADQMHINQELIAYLQSLQQQKASTGARSIRELRGLGKEIWAGVDAQAYVDAERDSWDG